MQDTEEIWRSVNGYDGIYEISSHGRIRSRIGVTFGHQEIAGYMVFRMYKDRAQKNIKVHRLVANAFIPNPNNKPFVNHIDFNRSNNHFSNLEWVSAKENAKHSSVNNRLSGRINAKGSNNNMAKLNEDKVIKIKTLLKEGKKLNDLAKMFDVCTSTICAIKNNRRWTFV